MIELDVGNYYGNLCIKMEGGKAYWCVENHDGHHWSEIPEDLYWAILKQAPKYDPNGKF